jgi:hypothetical protein
MPPCSLCRLNRKLINAHAIPEAFFRELRVDGEIPLLVSGEQGHFPKKAPIGVYDEGILCEVCEPTFGPVDAYGINVFLKDFDSDFKPLSRDGETAGFESATVDPRRLLQFLVSVLWRASISTHAFYSKVDLGPHEPLARLAVNTPGFALSEVFDAVLSRWKDEDATVPTTAILDPRREKWFGVNAYRLYLGETVAYVKVDAQPFPERMKAISLRSAPPVLVVARKMAESKDLRAMKHTVHRSHENKQTFASRRNHRPRAA